MANFRQCEITGDTSSLALAEGVDRTVFDIQNVKRTYKKRNGAEKRLQTPLIVETELEDSQLSKKRRKLSSSPCPSFVTTSSSSEHERPVLDVEYHNEGAIRFVQKIARKDDTTSLIHENEIKVEVVEESDTNDGRINHIESSLYDYDDFKDVRPSQEKGPDNADIKLEIVDEKDKEESNVVTDKGIPLLEDNVDVGTDILDDIDISLKSPPIMRVSGKNDEISCPYKCVQCKQLLATLSHLQIHKMVHHTGENTHACTICPKKLTSRLHLQRHMNKQHSPIIFPKICDKTSYCCLACRVGEVTLKLPDVTTASLDLDVETNSVHALARNGDTSINNVVNPTLNEENISYFNDVSACPVNNADGNRMIVEAGNNEKSNDKRTKDNAGNKVVIVNDTTWVKEKQMNVYEKKEETLLHKCDQCNSRFRNPTSLRCHKIMHTRKREIHRCIVCAEEYTKSYFLMEHMNKKHAELVDDFVNDKMGVLASQEGHVKDDCGVVKVGIKDATSEINKKIELPHRCDNCRLLFATLRRLRIHKMVHHTEKNRHKCTVCSKTIATFGGLERHMTNVHAIVPKKCGKYRYCCLACQAGVQTLKLPGVNLPMEEDCVEASDQDESNLVVGKGIPSLEDNVDVEAEILDGTDISSKRQHIMTASGKNDDISYPHRSDQCKQPLATLSQVQIHKMVHRSGDNTHACTVCPQKMTKFHSLQRHMKRKHSSYLDANKRERARYCCLACQVGEQTLKLPDITSASFERVNVKEAEVATRSEGNNSVGDFVTVKVEIEDESYSHIATPNQGNSMEENYVVVEAENNDVIMCNGITSSEDNAVKVEIEDESYSHNVMASQGNTIGEDCTVIAGNDDMLGDGSRSFDGNADVKVETVDEVIDISPKIQDLMAVSDKNEGIALPHRCVQCKQLFATLMRLQLHEMVHHSGENTHTCTVCPKKLRRRDHLQRHMKNIHSTHIVPNKGDKTRYCCLACQVGEKTLKLPPYENSHAVKVELFTASESNTSVDDSAIVKEEIDDQFNSPNVVAMQGNAIEEDRPVIEAVIEEESNSNDAMLGKGIELSNDFKVEIVDEDKRQHVIDVSEKKEKPVSPHRCCTCKQSFVTSLRLHIHKTVHHSERDTHTCTVCQKKLTRFSFLQTHMIKEHSSCIVPNECVNTRYCCLACQVREQTLKLPDITTETHESSHPDNFKEVTPDENSHAANEKETEVVTASESKTSVDEFATVKVEVEDDSYYQSAIADQRKAIEEDCLVVAPGNNDVILGKDIESVDDFSTVKLEVADDSYYQSAIEGQRKAIEEDYLVGEADVTMGGEIESVGDNVENLDDVTTGSAEGRNIMKINAKPTFVVGEKKNEEKRHKCDQCSHRFTTAYRLRIHKMAHNRNSCIACAKTFRSSDDLHTHMKIKHTSAPHKCDQCGRAFKNVLCLERHLAQH